MPEPKFASVTMYNSSLIWQKTPAGTLIIAFGGNPSDIFHVKAIAPFIFILASSPPAVKKLL